MKSATAEFPSVVAAKKVAVSELAYYRDMMAEKACTAQQGKKVAVKLTGAKASRIGKKTAAK